MENNHHVNFACCACGMDVNDSFHWLVEGVNGKEVWCADCHAEERDGIRDQLVWRHEKEKVND